MTKNLTNTKMLRGALLLAGGALVFAACSGEALREDPRALQGSDARPIDPAAARGRFDALARKDAARAVLDALQRLGCRPSGAPAGIELADGSLGLGDALTCADGATGSLSMSAAEDGDLQDVTALVNPRSPGGDAVFVTPVATVRLTPEELREEGRPSQGGVRPRGVLGWVRCKGCKLLVSRGLVTAVVGGSCEAAAGAACAVAGFAAAPLCITVAQELCGIAVSTAVGSLSEEACLRIGACP